MISYIASTITTTFSATFSATTTHFIYLRINNSNYKDIDNCLFFFDLKNNNYYLYSYIFINYYYSQLIK